MFKFAAVVFAVSVWIANGSSGTFTLQDSLLAGYTYETLTGVGWLECLQNCLTDARCLSYNYFKARDEQANKCELNGKAFDNMCEAQKHVITSPSWIYNQIKENVKTLHHGCFACNGLITANVSCDNLCTIYADGKSLGEDNKEWRIVTTFTFPKGTKIIGIHGKDKDHIGAPSGAFIGSFSNGMVTNRSWKCSKTHSAEWSTESFDDTAWPAAVEYGENGDAPWTPKVKHIASGAKWIWTQDNTNVNKVYCRVKV